MKYDNQLRYAKKIVSEYDGSAPLSLWLKDFYRINKQMGSRDRKTLSALVYSYYRLGHNDFPGVEERLHAAIQLSSQLNELKEYFSSSPDYTLTPEKTFPWMDQLSEGIDKAAFAASFLVQPDLYLRVRPGKMDIVIQKLNAAGISFSICNDGCIALPNSSKVDEVVTINREAVIQDKSSQQTATLLTEAQRLLKKKNIELWDCCAASGGKSIMAVDTLGDTDITVSDIRESIISNLRRRFEEAGIMKFRYFVTDLTGSAVQLPPDKYDLIIADVPCTGSGTWARTPEQLYFFTKEKINYYCNLQKKIVTTVMRSLKPGAMLVYITCSVFRSENEEVVSYMEREGLHLIAQKIFAGYNDKADTLFGALLTTPSV